MKEKILGRGNQIVPGKPKEVLDMLIERHHHSVRSVAKKLRVGHKTLTRIRQGENTSADVDLKLLSLYLQESLM